MAAVSQFADYHRLERSDNGCERFGVEIIELPLFRVPRRPQRQDLLPDLWADRYVAPAVRASWTSLAVCKSP